MNTCIILAMKDTTDQLCSFVQDLKKVCLDFVAKNLQPVLETEGYKHLSESCPGLQGDIIQTVASLSEARSGRQHHFRMHNRESIEEAGRRVRQRRAE